ncbi:restriction endonuclease subunit S [Stutzerimonas degradans]|uniref:restriction endonuclease subunit S n=1 Tax=Stutzerimonas degradans TaxID=2968968 RepID=UPI0028D7DC01|nr:restriction endonuclease subunit S [Stutzerimonas degradans]
MSHVFPANWDVLPFSLAVKDATSEYSKLQKSEYLVQGRFPIVDQGQQKFGGYTDDESVVSLDVGAAIVFGDHTRIFKFIDEPFCLGADGAKVLEPKVELDKKFLFYYLSSLSIESAGYSRHFKFLKENVVPVPPLSEQKRIAAILDKADDIRRKRQQAIQLADDFLRAVFLDMFGDPRDSLTIEDMLSQKYLLLHKDGNHGSNYPAKEEFGDDGVVFISAKDISDQDGSVDYASVAHLNESKAKKITIGWLEKGDVLLAHNATVGRVGLFDGEVGEALIGTSLTAFRPNQEKLSSVYLFAALKYSGFQAQLKQNMGQSTRNQVPIAAQKSLKIPVVNLKRQRQFEQVFVKLKRAKSNLYAGLKESDEMFSSLSQKAFAGQL